MSIKWFSSQEDACWREQMPTTSAETANLALTEEQFQTIKGFGGCFNEMGWEALKQLSDDDRQLYFQEMFTAKGCGFTFCRMPIGANDYAMEWYSLSEVDDDFEMAHFSMERDRKYLVPYIKEAMQLQPELAIFASPWSPPTWMKQPKAYNYGNLKQDDRVLKAYALYFKKFYEAYKAEGINIEQIHIQNEPNSNQKFPSCVWTGAEMRDFIKNYIGPLFEQENVPCEIWAGTIERGIEHGWEIGRIGADNYTKWAHTILSDPDAYKYVKGVGYQWDGKGALQRTHLTWPEMPIIQTENECGDGQNSWAYACYVYDLMWQYFVNGTVAYTYWNMILPEGGESTWGWKQNAMCCVSTDNKLVFNPEFYVMKHIAHFVKPGAVRKGLKGMWSAFSLAFENPDGSTVILVKNPYEETGTLNVELDDKNTAFPLAPMSINTIQC